MLFRIVPREEFTMYKGGIELLPLCIVLLNDCFCDIPLSFVRNKNSTENQMNITYKMQVV